MSGPSAPGVFEVEVGASPPEAPAAGVPYLETGFWLVRGVEGNAERRRGVPFMASVVSSCQADLVISIGAPSSGRDHLSPREAEDTV